MPRHSHAPFAPTQWSLILSAQNPDQSSHRAAALEQLARTYWPPLYAYLRRQGLSPDHAQDLTQDFFTRLLEKHALHAVDPAKGKFRSFLLASLKHFLANEYDKACTQKRGGHLRHFSLSANDLTGESGAESRIAAPDTRTPEQLFDHQWALTLLHGVIDALRAEYAARAQQPLFDALHAALTGDLPEPYVVVAARLHTTEGALQAAAHRLRKRYRQLLRDHIAQTVADPSLIDDELRDLLNAL